MYSQLLNDLNDKKGLLDLLDKRLGLKETLQTIADMLGVTEVVDTTALMCSLIMYLKQNNDRKARVNYLVCCLNHKEQIIEFSTKEQVIEFMELIDLELPDTHSYLGELFIKHEFTIDEMLVLEKAKPLLYCGAISYVFLHKKGPVQVLPVAQIFEYVRQRSENNPQLLVDELVFSKLFTLAQVKSILLEQLPAFYKASGTFGAGARSCRESNGHGWKIQDFSTEDRLEIFYAIHDKVDPHPWGHYYLLDELKLAEHFGVPDIKFNSIRSKFMDEERYSDLEKVIIDELNAFNAVLLREIGFDKLAAKIIGAKAGTINSAHNMSNMLPFFEECYYMLIIRKHRYTAEQLLLISRMIFEMFNYSSADGRMLLLEPLRLILKTPSKLQLFEDRFARLPSRTLLAALCFVAIFETNAHIKLAEDLLANMPTFYNDGQYQRTLIRTIIPILQQKNKHADHNEIFLKVLRQILAPIKTNIIFEPAQCDYVISDHNSIDILVTVVGGALQLTIKGIDTTNRQFMVGYPTPKSLLDTPLTKKERLTAKLLSLAPQIISSLQKTGLLFDAALLQQKSLYIVSSISRFDSFVDIIANSTNLSVFELQRQYALAFAKTFNISEKGFARYINPLRKNEAILLYRNALLALDEDVASNDVDGLESTPYIDLLNKFVQALARPSYATYKQQRYYPEEENIHLATVAAKHDKTYKLWQEDNCLPLVAIQHKISVQDNSLKIDTYDILFNAIVKHNHLNLQYFAAVDAYFKDGNDGAKLALQRMTNDPNQSNRNRILLKLIRKAKVGTNPKHLQQEIDDAIKALNYSPPEQLLSDLAMLKNAICALSINSEHINIDHLRVANTDAPWQMFLLGTDVEGSCQHVESQGTNHALIGGYVMSGHVRQISILDPANKIVARSILRLLWDPEHLKPVLHIEEVYPGISSLFSKESILYYARLVGLKLELDVVSSQPSVHKCLTYDYRLQCLQVNLAEYVDTLHKEQNAPYELPAKSTTQLFNFKQFRQQMFAQTSKLLGPGRLLRDATLMYKS